MSPRRSPPASRREASHPGPGASDLDAVADDLYGLPPSEFTAARDARAADIRAAGDKALSAEVKRLRRPTTGAWLANLLARERSEEIARLAGLGEALRRAQEDLAGADLRRLSEERRRLVADLADEGRRLAEAAGRPVGGTALTELGETLEAALADPEAAAALRQGRLSAARSYSGLGFLALPDAGADAAGASKRRGSASPKDDRPRRDTPSPARRSQQARRALEAATRRANAADEEVARARRKAEEARAAAAAAREALAAAEGRARKARAARGAAAREADAAERERAGEGSTKG